MRQLSLLFFLALLSWTCRDASATKKVDKLSSAKQSSINYGISIDAGTESSTITMLKGDKKLKSFKIDGQAITTSFADLNKDKNPEIVIIKKKDNHQEIEVYEFNNSKLIPVQIDHTRNMNNFFATGFSVVYEQLMINYSYMEDGKEMQTTLAYNLYNIKNKLILKPEGWSTEKLSSMSGQYVSRNQKETGHYQTLQLNPTENGQWHVAIRMKDIITKDVICEFQGIGDFYNKDLFVPLNQQKAFLRGVLQIRFVENFAFVFTSNPENKDELTQFCKSAGSIAGHFKKTDI